MIKLFIKILKEHCHECYACVRNCPVSAVKVNNGRVEIIENRCINCGKCVDLCSQNAREIISEADKVLNLLKEDENISAAIAPSFPAYKIKWKREDWLDFLKAINFNDVYDVAWGAEIICNEYKNLIEQKEEKLISSACPVIVNLVNKYYPELSKYLVPLVSPMQALVRYLKKYEPEQKIVLIGPCQAKKMELAEDENIAAVITFSEAFEIAEALNPNLAESIGKRDLDENISGEANWENNIDEMISSGSRSLAVGGSLYKKTASGVENSYHVEGEKEVIEFLEALKNGEIELKFADLLFCRGCLDGFDLKSENYFTKKKCIDEYVSNNSSFNTYSREAVEEIDLKTNFTAESISFELPNEKEIWEILNKTNKYSEDDLLDCGACGYSSCREKAAAVYQGLAEVNICLPFLLREKRREVKEIQQINKNLDLIINSSYDGIILLDKEGSINKINDSYLQMLNLEADELSGKRLKEVEERLNIYPSFDLQKLKQKDKLTFVQTTSQEKRLLLTAKAIRNSENELQQIIINARDLAELDLINTSSQKDQENIPGYIISKSSEMKKILKLASQIAKTDSTVLITGESGVGKEVVARYIYEQSDKKNNFVKINCAAIPETLLESELFGYEKGAFSGARRNGKPGLIEEADKGTLFLDEIGELSLNMQAKLLQVLQEHSVCRIGSVKPKKVDFRLITATNRNLEEMVADKDFREDLYYRLNVLPIKVPPLRNRRVDIPPLINHFVSMLSQKYDKEINITNNAVELFMKYDWPGNVRELNNIIERLIITSEKTLIEYEDAASLFDSEFNEKGISVSSVMPLSQAVAEVEKKILKMVQDNCRSTYEMADILEVNQSTVVRKLKKYFH